MMKSMILLLSLSAASYTHGSEIKKDVTVECTRGTVSVHTKLHNLQLYVFDLDGQLVLQTEVNPEKKKIKADLPKGAYLYNILNQDKVLKTGTLTIK